MSRAPEGAARTAGARRLVVRAESFALVGAFRISRGAKTHAEVVTVELFEGERAGRGECVPYARYGEGVETTIAAIEGMRERVESGLDKEGLAEFLGPGAARNALDCALWDLEAKRTGRRVFDLAGLPPPEPVVTAFTLSLDEPGRMAAAARAAVGRPLLKLKLGAEGDVARVEAVRAARPDARLIVDANEGWTAEQTAAHVPLLKDLGVELIEQPLPADADEALRDRPRPVPLGADESCHTEGGLERLKGLYDVVNVKLDKTGGLTGALRLIEEAESLGFGVMVGCMVGTSLGTAPAALLAAKARFVDLDGPLLLAEDREPSLRYEGSLLHPSEPELWG